MEKPMHFDEVQKYLGMGSDYVYKKLQSGQLVGYKLGNKWVVYPSDLKKFLERQPSNRRRIRNIV